MKDSRIGQSLWSTWEGNGYTANIYNSIIYYTEDHVDVEHEVVKRALASCIQRDGIVFSLSQGFQAIDSAVVTQSWVGSLDGEIYLELCDESGHTWDEVKLQDIKAVTIVEVPDLV
jgi:hypothetical protein